MSVSPKARRSVVHYMVPKPWTRRLDKPLETITTIISVWPELQLCIPTYSTRNIRVQRADVLTRDWSPFTLCMSCYDYSKTYAAITLRQCAMIGRGYAEPYTQLRRPPYLIVVGEGLVGGSWPHGTVGYRFGRF